jgi:hypothetical protein
MVTARHYSSKQTVDGNRGFPADLAWQPIPGVEDKASLLILDRNNNLFSYDTRWGAAHGHDSQANGAAQQCTYNGLMADEGATRS